ncbi:MAG: hypothetical protein HQM16_19590 [Deltaproteobacteria bacterium]|nr:hypothetical protein [Deltaproteobacteria bacterium]
MARSQIQAHRDFLLKNRIIKPQGKTDQSGMHYRVFLPHEFLNLPDNKAKTIVKYRKSSLSVEETQVNIMQSDREPRQSLANSGIPNFSDDFLGMPVEGSNHHNVSGIPDSSGGHYNPNNINTLQSKEISGIPDNAQHINKTLLKSSSGKSGDDDDFLNKKKSESSSSPTSPPSSDPSSSDDPDEFFQFLDLSFEDRVNQFPISRTVVEKYIALFGLERCKHHITLLKTKILEADSSVGFWIHSLKNPDAYPELNSAAAKPADHLEAPLIKTREMAYEDEQTKTVLLLAERHWEQLDASTKGRLIAEKQQQMAGDKNGFKIPETAIIRAARERAFWEAMDKKWQSLSTAEQTQMTDNAKTHIIQRIYAKQNSRGEVIIPQQIPQTDFAKKINETAQVTAKVSLAARGR